MSEKMKEITYSAYDFAKRDYRQEQKTIHISRM